MKDHHWNTIKDMINTTFPSPSPPLVVVIIRVINFNHLSESTRMLEDVEHGGLCAVDDAVEDMRFS